MRSYCWDVETLRNCFTATFVHVDTKEVMQFVIHESRNDYSELKRFYRSCTLLIGYNSVDFDDPTIYPFMVESFEHLNGAELAERIYNRAQEVIESNNPDNNIKREWYEPIVKQMDLYRIWHFNNKARSTSLKWLQINMDWPNVQEMPIKHTETIGSDQIPMILEYNLNDVLTTLEFLKRSKSQITLRKALSEKYGIDMTNYSDNKIGEKIFTVELCKRMKVSEKELKKLKTFRKEIIAKDCILSSIKFETKEFNSVKEQFNRMIITDTRSEEEISVVLDGVTYHFGLGGIHAFREAGLYEGIVSADVSSYYPNLAINYGFHPKHLGTTFCVIYKSLYDERKLYAKGTSENASLKLSLNGAFGQSNAPWSIFYDPMFTMQITLNGQLLLAMLCEKITIMKAGRVIMANTDGIEIDIIDKHKFWEICKWWMASTKLELEFSKLSKLACRDVNNYIAIKDGETKEKGDFECEREIYKSQSMKIVPLAVREFFLNGTPVEDTINQCEDLKMFIMGHRAKTGNLRFRGVLNNLYTDQTLPKNVRYFISSTGGSIVKVTKKTKKTKDKTISPNQLSMFSVNEISTETKEKITNLHKGYRMTLFNIWVDKPFNEYRIDKTFYIREAKKLIEGVLSNQTTI